MLKPQALANSFTITTALLYILLYLLRVIAPPFFNLLLNSQFFGADIASQVPKFSLVNFVGILIAVCIIAWVFGYILAASYNRLAETKS